MRNIRRGRATRRHMDVFNDVGNRTALYSSRQPILLEKDATQGTIYKTSMYGQGRTRQPTVTDITHQILPLVIRFRGDLPSRH